MFFSSEGTINQQSMRSRWVQLDPNELYNQAKRRKLTGDLEMEDEEYQVCSGVEVHQSNGIVNDWTRLDAPDKNSNRLDEMTGVRFQPFQKGSQN